MFANIKLIVILRMREIDLDFLIYDIIHSDIIIKSREIGVS